VQAIINNNPSTPPCLRSLFSPCFAEGYSVSVKIVSLIAYAQHGVRSTKENCASNNNTKAIINNNPSTPPCLRTLHSPRFAEGQSVSDHHSSVYHLSVYICGNLCTRRRPEAVAKKIRPSCLFEIFVKNLHKTISF
jgi:hypothetical protein